ncbi:MAG: peptidoglycan-binding protein [FCB group bacterium]|nr:peptidoglycan-binding protein [FCB group bacterium]
MSIPILKSNYRKGSRGKSIRLIQELLCLNGPYLEVDGDFGSATDYAVRLFQMKNRLPVSGIVNKSVFDSLIQPLKRAEASLSPGRKTLGQVMVALAKQHLKENPREIGGQNMGLWVRLYMNNNQGAQWPWCAGFVCHLMETACRILGLSKPIKSSFSCDFLAGEAKRKGLFLKEPAAAGRSKITPGSIFLQRRTATDWTHTGLVVETDGKVFHTIEGNTNDGGSREGYEVCRRIRGFRKKDFILIDGQKAISD